MAEAKERPDAATLPSTSLGLELLVCCMPTRRHDILSQGCVRLWIRCGAARRLKFHPLSESGTQFQSRISIAATFPYYHSIKQRSNGSRRARARYEMDYFMHQRAHPRPRECPFPDPSFCPLKIHPHPPTPYVIRVW